MVARLKDLSLKEGDGSAHISDGPGEKRMAWSFLSVIFEESTLTDNQHEVDLDIFMIIMARLFSRINLDRS